MKLEFAELENRYLISLRKLAAASGWRVSRVDQFGVEFTRSRTYSKFTLIYGGIFTLFFGIGLFLLLWGFGEYLSKNDEVLFIPMEELSARNVDVERFC